MMPSCRGANEKWCHGNHRPIHRERFFNVSSADVMKNMKDVDAAVRRRRRVQCCLMTSRRVGKLTDRSTTHTHIHTHEQTDRRRDTVFTSSNAKDAVIIETQHCRLEDARHYSTLRRCALSEKKKKVMGSRIYTRADYTEGRRLR